MPQDSLGLQIEESLENFLPEHTDSEMDAMRDAVLSDGRFTDPLLACQWNGRTVLVDGHGRYRLWLSLPEETHVEPPRVEVLDFSTFDEARAWMAQHALGRRNLLPQQRKYLTGAKYNAEKGAQGRPIKKSLQFEDFNEPIKTVKKIAEEEKISKSTVERSGKFTEALDRIGAVDSQFPGEVLSGRCKMTDEKVLNLGSLADSKMKAAIESIKSGKAFDKKAGEAAKKKVAVDGNGKPIPKQLTEVFGATEKFRGLQRRLTVLVGEIQELADTEAGVLIPRNQVRIEAKNLAATFKFFSPHHVCPDCKGFCCDQCDGRGWKPKNFAEGHAR